MAITRIDRLLPKARTYFIGVDTADRGIGFNVANVCRVKGGHLEFIHSIVERDEEVFHRAVSTLTQFYHVQTVIFGGA